MSVVVLAYSGGSASRRALRELVAAGREVVTLSLDVGQGGDLADVRSEALAAGALRAHVLDTRENYAAEVLLPALRAGVRVDGYLPTPQVVLAPWIASQLAVVCKMESTVLVAHGARGADGRRLDSSVMSIDPSLSIVRLPGGSSRDDDPNPHTHTNVWGRTLPVNMGSDTWSDVDEAAFTLTRAPDAASDLPAFVEVDCRAGVPIAVNGVSMSFVDVLTSLETIAGDHGVGRLDIIEHAPGGAARRVVAEIPAVVVLDTALRALESLVQEPVLARLSRQVGGSCGDMLAAGTWSSAARDAMLAFVDGVHRQVTGTVRVRLFKGECRVVGRRSPFSRCAQPASVPVRSAR